MVKSDCDKALQILTIKRCMQYIQDKLPSAYRETITHQAIRNRMYDYMAMIDEEDVDGTES